MSTALFTKPPADGFPAIQWSVWYYSMGMARSCQWREWLNGWKAVVVKRAVSLPILPPLSHYFQISVAIPVFVFIFFIRPTNLFDSVFFFLFKLIWDHCCFRLQREMVQAERQLAVFLQNKRPWIHVRFRCKTCKY